jgi:hypothetical protein
MVYADGVCIDNVDSEDEAKAVIANVIMNSLCEYCHESTFSL